MWDSYHVCTSDGCSRYSTLKLKGWAATSFDEPLSPRPSSLWSHGSHHAAFFSVVRHLDFLCWQRAENLQICSEKCHHVVTRTVHRIQPSTGVQYWKDQSQNSWVIFLFFGRSCFLLKRRLLFLLLTLFHTEEIQQRRTAVNVDGILVIWSDILWGYGYYYMYCEKKRQWDVPDFICPTLFYLIHVSPRHCFKLSGGRTAM